MEGEVLATRFSHTYLRVFSCCRTRAHDERRPTDFRHRDFTRWNRGIAGCTVNRAVSCVDIVRDVCATPE